AAAVVSAHGFEVPVVSERGRRAEVDALSVEPSRGVADLAAETVARASRPHVHDAVEGAGPVQRSTGPTHELKLLDVGQRERQRRPIDVAEEGRQRRIAAVDARQNVPVVEVVEAAAIEVEVVEAALYDLHSRRTRQPPAHAGV